MLEFCNCVQEEEVLWKCMVDFRQLFACVNFATGCICTKKNLLGIEASIKPCDLVMK